jgi:hypothetical protein
MKDLISLEEHNKAVQEQIFTPYPKPNGIACPICQNELLDINNNVQLYSCPAQVHVKCSVCDWVGTRFI